MRDFVEVKFCGNEGASQEYSVCDQSAGVKRRREDESACLPPGEPTKVRATRGPGPHTPIEWSGLTSPNESLPVPRLRRSIPIGPEAIAESGGRPAGDRTLSS